MSQAPSMPLYVDALIGDTMHLSVDEFGAYCLLLFATWRNNGRPLPDDATKLSRICRVSPARWQKSLRAKLVSFFNVDERGWHQKRLEKEWHYVEKKRANLARNGERGRAARALKKNGTPLADGNADEYAPNPRGSLYNKYNNSTSAPACASAVPAAGAASGAAPTPAEIGEVERLVQSVTATNGVHRALTPPAPSKRDAWLNNLSAWVGTAEQLDFNDRMVAWQMIEDCRVAGCRARTPPHIRTALDRISKLRLQQRRAA